jgi:hypothetical protein
MPVTRQRLDTSKAAQALGISPDAVRKRVSRGLLESEKGQGGKLYVWIDLDTPKSGHGTPDDTPRHGTSEDRADRDELVERMASEIDHLRDQLDKEREANRENRRLLAAALERIPAIEAPSDTPSSSPSSEPRGSSVSDEEGPPYGTAPEAAEESLHHVPYGEAPRGDTEPSRAPWWRRLFG